MPAEQRREQILEVAARVFSDKGYRQASVSDIVEEAGIGRGTFYIYFKSKKDIFLELIEAYFLGLNLVLERNHGELEDAFEAKGRVLRTWRDNMMRFLRYHIDNPHLTRIAYHEAMGRDEDFSERTDVHARLARDKLEQEFRMMYDHGMMRGCDLEVVTTIIMGSSINVVLEHLMKKSGRDIDELVDMIVEYHIRALIPEEGDTSRALRSALG